MGKDGFEPPNSEEDRFTVCCRWPLGYLPGIVWRHPVTLFLFLSQRRDSNPRPADYKSAALPTELLWPVFRFRFKLLRIEPDQCHLSYAEHFLWNLKELTQNSLCALFFGKAKVIEFVKCKNFESVFFWLFSGARKVIEKRPCTNCFSSFPDKKKTFRWKVSNLVYAACFSFFLFIWFIQESNALSKDSSNDLEDAFTKN